MILLLFILTSLVLYYYWKRRKLIWLAGKIKGPRGFPIIGSAYKFLNSNTILEEVRKFGDAYGSGSKFWLGNRLFVYIKDPTQCELILNNTDCLDKGESYNFMFESIGLGLITLKSEEWRFHRKKLNSCFSFNIVNSFYPIFNKNLKILIGKLKQHVDNGPFDIQKNLKSCAMDMICETTFGLKMQTQTEKNLDFLHAAHIILVTTGLRFFQPWIQPKMLFRLSKHYKGFSDSVAKLVKVVDELFASKKKEYFATATTEKSQTKDGYESNDNTGSTEKNIFINQIIKLALEEKSFTMDDVTSELKTILMAGFETTATSATTTFALLAMHPDIQEKLFQEIRSVLPNQTDDPTRENIQNMPYLDAFLKESFRFYPTVPFLTRIVKKEMQLEDVIIPKGTEYVIDIYSMHRNKNIWKFDATKFNPENFFPENIANRHAYAYIPFSAGPRNCIGLKYGNIALKLFVVHVVRQYRITTKTKLEELKFRMSVTSNITNENIFELHNRENY